MGRVSEAARKREKVRIRECKGGERERESERQR